MKMLKRFLKLPNLFLIPFLLLCLAGIALLSPAFGTSTAYATEKFVIEPTASAVHIGESLHLTVTARTDAGHPYAAAGVKLILSETGTDVFDFDSSGGAATVFTWAPGLDSGAQLPVAYSNAPGGKFISLHYDSGDTIALGGDKLLGTINLKAVGAGSITVSVDTSDATLTYILDDSGTTFYTITAGTAQTYTSSSATATTAPSYTISGQVFRDNNDNTLQDTGEANWTDASAPASVALFDSSGSRLDTFTTSATNNGAFSFTGLSPGTYTLSFTIADSVFSSYTIRGKVGGGSPSTLTSTSNSLAVTITSSSQRAYFGLHPNPTATPTMTLTPTATTTPTSISCSGGYTIAGATLLTGAGALTRDGGPIFLVPQGSYILTMNTVPPVATLPAGTVTFPTSVSGGTGATDMTINNSLPGNITLNIPANASTTSVVDYLFQPTFGSGVTVSFPCPHIGVRVPAASVIPSATPDLTCHHSSTEVRVQTISSTTAPTPVSPLPLWSTGGPVRLGDIVRIAAFHDGETGSYATDTTISVSGPQGSRTLRTTYPHNGDTITITEPGEYTLGAIVPGITDPKCIGAATLTVNPQVAVSYAISETASDINDITAGSPLWTVFNPADDGTQTIRYHFVRPAITPTVAVSTGAKTIYIRFKNNTGAFSPVYSATIAYNGAIIISGSVFIDTNNNNLKDGDELNWTDTTTNPLTVLLDNSIAQDITSGGSFSFTGFTRGSTHHIMLKPKNAVNTVASLYDDLKATINNEPVSAAGLERNIDIVVNGNKTVLFGLHPRPAAPTATTAPSYTISGQVFRDNNDNTLQDTGEANWTDASAPASVALFDSSGSRLDTFTTSATNNGAFSFTGLSPGTYTLSFTIADSVFSSYTIRGKVGGGSPSTLTSTSNSLAVTITSSSQRAYFGLHPNPTATPTMTLTPTPRPVRGDADNNFCVDTRDFSEWLLESTGRTARKKADWSGPSGVPDGKVDRYDYAVWLEAYNSGQYPCPAR